MQRVDKHAVTVREFLLAVLTAAGATSGCVFSAAPPDRAQLLCSSNADCGDGGVCAASIGRCVPIADLEDEPPELSSIELLDVDARDGVSVDLTFSVNELLFTDPIVRFDGGTFTLNDADTDRGARRYAFNHTVSVAEPATATAVVVDLIDRVGNVANDLQAGEIRRDFDAPTLALRSVVPTVVASGGSATFTLTFSEPVFEPAVDFAGTALVSSMEHDGPVVTVVVQETVGALTAISGVASARDAAGNGVSGAPFGVPVDLLPLNVTDTSIAPATVGAGRTVFATITASEEFGATQALVLDAVDAGGATAFSLEVADVVGTVAVLFASVPPNVLDGAYTTVLRGAFDVAGNLSADLALPATINVDNSPPQLASVGLSRERLSVHPPHNALTVMVSASSDAVGISAAMDEVALDCVLLEVAATADFECDRLIDGTEREGARIIVVEVIDGAGNISVEALPIVIDFSAPDVIDATVTLRYVAPAGSPVGAPAAAAVGAGVIVNFAVSEVLLGGTVTLETASEPEFEVTAIGANVTGTKLVTSSPIEGEDLIVVTARDDVDNVRIRTIGTTPPFIVDTVPPASPDVDGEGVVHERFPVGGRLLGNEVGQRIRFAAGSVEADTQVVITDRAVPPFATLGGAFVAPASETLVPLAVGDNMEVFVQAIDGAGNGSTRVRVRRGTIVIDPSGPTSGQGGFQIPPLSVAYHPGVEGLRAAFGAYSDAFSFDQLRLVETDGIVATASGELDQHRDFQQDPPANSAVFAFDASTAVAIGIEPDGSQFHFVAGDWRRAYDGTAAPQFSNISAAFAVTDEELHVVGIRVGDMTTTDNVFRFGSVYDVFGEVSDKERQAVRVAWDARSAQLWFTEGCDLSGADCSPKLHVGASLTAPALQIAPDPVDGEPTLSMLTALAFDDTRRLLVVASADVSDASKLSIWETDGVAWSLRVIAGLSAPATTLAAAFDSAIDAVRVVAGGAGASIRVNQTITETEIGGLASSVTAAIATPLLGAARFISHDASGVTLWRFEGDAPVSLDSTRPGAVPRGASRTQLTHDPSSGAVFVYLIDDVSEEVWSLSPLTGYVKLADCPVGPPSTTCQSATFAASQRARSRLLFDPGVDTLLMVGGGRASDHVVGSTDVFSFDAATWFTQIAATVDPAAELPLRDAAVAIDGAGDIVMFGGYRGDGPFFSGGDEVLGRTLVYHRETSTVSLPVDAADEPAPRFGARMVLTDDASGSRLFLIGGTDPLQNACSDVVYERVANQWIARPGALPPVVSALAWWDASLGQVVAVATDPPPYEVQRLWGLDASDEWVALPGQYASIIGLGEAAVTASGVIFPTDLSYGGTPVLRHAPNAAPTMHIVLQLPNAHVVPNTVMDGLELYARAAGVGGSGGAGGGAVLDRWDRDRWVTISGTGGTTPTDLTGELNGEEIARAQSYDRVQLRIRSTGTNGTGFGRLDVDEVEVTARYRYPP